MQGLHAGDDAKFSETRDVGFGDGFDVLDARAAAGGVIGDRSVFVGVQCGSNGAVTDGMSEQLEAAFIELRDGGSVFFGVPEGFAFGGRIVGVRIEHGGSVRFDYAVEHHFDDVAVNPIVVIFPASIFDGLEVLSAQFWRVEKVGDVEAQG
jgi:hypothetical protein